MNFKLNTPFYFLALLFVTSQLCFSQSRIQNLIATQYKDVVQLDFLISAGNACSGYQIWTSADSINFNLVFDYQGVCGEISKAQRISYTHITPKINAKNYYRIVIAPSDFSAIASVTFYDYTTDGLIMLPNPVSKYLTIITSDEKFKEVFIYNNNAELLFMLPQLITGANTIDLTFLPNGIYIIVIETLYAKKIVKRIIKSSFN